MDVIVGAEDYIRPKPNPDPILVALRKINAHSNKTIYVGDVEADCIAAKKANVKFALIIRNNKGRFNICKPDFTLYSLFDLMDIVLK